MVAPLFQPMSNMSLCSTSAPPPHFSLLDDVIVLTDAAARSGDPAKVVQALTGGLQGLLSGPMELPEWLLETQAEGHARRELYRSREHGYEVVAITWAPGQDSTVHDHGDTWGVESVLRGRIEVIDYRVLCCRRRRRSRSRPARTRRRRAGYACARRRPTGGRPRVRASTRLR